MPNTNTSHAGRDAPYTAAAQQCEVTAIRHSNTHIDSHVSRLSTRLLIGSRSTSSFSSGTMRSNTMSPSANRPKLSPRMIRVLGGISGISSCTCVYHVLVYESHRVLARPFFSVGWTGADRSVSPVSVVFGSVLRGAGGEMGAVRVGVDADAGLVGRCSRCLWWSLVLAPAGPVGRIRRGAARSAAAAANFAANPAFGVLSLTSVDNIVRV